MYVVVEFGGGECLRMECNGVEIITGLSGEDHSEGVIGGVGLDDQRSSRDELGEHRSGGESFLEGIEGFLTSESPIPRSVLMV